jgi:hypothetical protein
MKGMVWLRGSEVVVDAASVAFGKAMAAIAAPPARRTSRLLALAVNAMLRPLVGVGMIASVWASPRLFDEEKLTHFTQRCELTVVN